MEIGSNAIGDYEIGGDYDTTIQWLIEEQITITESFSRYHDWFFEEQIDVIENITFGFSHIWAETISIIETFAYKMLGTGIIKKMTNLWNKTKEVMNKLKP